MIPYELKLLYELWHFLLLTAQHYTSNSNEISFVYSVICVFNECIQKHDLQCKFKWMFSQKSYSFLVVSSISEVTFALPLDFFLNFFQFLFTIQEIRISRPRHILNILIFFPSHPNFFIFYCFRILFLGNSQREKEK